MDVRPAPGPVHARLTLLQEPATLASPIPPGHQQSTGAHPRLAEVVQRHLRQPHRQPLAARNDAAWNRLEQALDRGRPLVLDSFCGTGMSTALLAAQHPEHLVVGIDKSAHRLARHQRTAESERYLLLQADCEDIWQRLWQGGWQLDYHYLLYPNPWPKAAHLQRRIHGHPGLRALLALGGQLELRSNWQLYVEEFGLALHIAGRRGWVARLPEQASLTLFEEKYRRSGQPLWQYRAAAPVTNAPIMV
ncbi:tRNA (guanine(46)-N(7))-methyltransferase TrmB [Kineobactrum salinum]|uniref:tRNA (guanine(46)-N(7))-methyltransferase TrmB n=1 Tax=Kineobactrum salinum TaxID=2708301 RepID=UPI001E4D2E25|nr:methyltransferase domain-containing protein [Kineobactrum salinum]